MAEATEYRFSGIEMDNPLWHFALRFWSLPDAEASCLSLQGQGWNVTGILAAVWLASGRKVYTGEPEQASTWRQEYTLPLRRMRKAIPGDQPEMAEVRNRLARSELAAEQVELALMYDAHRNALTTTGAPMPILVRNLKTASPEKPQQEDITVNEDIQRLLRIFRHHLADKGETDREVPSC